MRQVGVDLLDGVDLHGKWPQGGGGASVSFEHYMSEVPLLDSKCKNSWRQRLAGLRNVTVSLGRPDFMLMNLEFGLGYASAAVWDSRVRPPLLHLPVGASVHRADGVKPPSCSGRRLPSHPVTQLEPNPYRWRSADSH